MPARRCPRCLTNWPVSEDYADCPQCEKPTTFRFGLEALEDDRARSIMLHHQFERYYAKRELEQVAMLETIPILAE